MSGSGPYVPNLETPSNRKDEAGDSETGKARECIASSSQMLQVFGSQLTSQLEDEEGLHRSRASSRKVVPVEEQIGFKNQLVPLT